MAKVYKTTFKIRRGTSEVFERNNPILQYGEPCFVKDKNGFKIGDGETDWINLPYIGLVDEQPVERGDWNENNPESPSYINNRTHYHWWDTLVSTGSRTLIDENGDTYNVVLENINYIENSSKLDNSQFIVVLNGTENVISVQDVLSKSQQGETNYDLWCGERILTINLKLVKNNNDSYNLICGSYPYAIELICSIIYQKKKTYYLDESYLSEEIARREWVKKYVGQSIADSEHTARKIVDELPSVEEAEPNVVYMILVESIESGDKYKEYMLIDGELIQIGDTSIDLTDYIKISESEINNLIAQIQ